MCLSCPHTSPQNGWAERIIHTTNDIMRSLMFQASILIVYWAEALRTTTYLLNLSPTKALSFTTPHFALSNVHQTSHTYMFLRANVIPTSLPQSLINSLPVLLFVSSLVIQRSTRAIVVSI
jgi:hypothetical protein